MCEFIDVASNAHASDGKKRSSPIKPSAGVRVLDQQYEELRRCQFDHERGWGLSLFMRQGMAAWVRACETEISVVAAGNPIHGRIPPDLKSEPPVTPEIPSELRLDITTHIVNMIQSRMEVT